MKRMQLTALCVMLAGTAACGKDSPTPIGPIPNQTTPTTPTPPSTPIQVTGTVVEIGGGPVPDAIVSGVVCNGGRVLAETRTDGTGGFEVTFDSPAPTACLRTAKEGYVGPTVGIGTQSSELTIRLQRLRQTTGNIEEVEGGAVAGAKVWTEGNSTLTDALGFFTLSGVAYGLNVAADGFVGRQVFVAPGQDVSLGIVRIQRQILLSGASSLASQVSSKDIEYDLSDEEYSWWCGPCKRIDLQTGRQDVNVRLRWEGALPLQLWAGGDPAAGAFKTATAEPGESALVMRVPVGTPYLLVGYKSGPGFPLTLLQQPVAFELTTTPCASAPAQGPCG